jgi:transposase, IS30 family
MPKGTDLSLLSVRDLNRISRSLNNRPRKTLEYMKPSEKLAELLALTSWTRRVITVTARSWPFASAV